MLVVLAPCSWDSPSVFAADPFIIDDENLSFETLYSATIYGFRSFPVSNIVGTDWKTGFEIKADVLNSSLEQIMPGKPVTLHELTTMPPPVSTASQGYTPVFITADYEERTNLAWQKFSVPSSGEYDARFIASAFGTELVDHDFVQNQETSVDKIKAIELDHKVATDLLTAYSGLNTLSLRSNKDIISVQWIQRNFGPT